MTLFVEALELENRNGVCVSDVMGLKFSGFGRAGPDHFGPRAGRAFSYQASGGPGLTISGLGPGRAFLCRASGFFRAFPKYKMYPHFCLMSMKYEVLLLNFLKLSLGYRFGPI